MNFAAGQLGMLAQVYREDLGRGFRGATSQLGWQVLVPYAIAAAVGALGILVYVHVKKRNDMSEPCDDPQKLFRELCRTHKLDRASQRLLVQLAEAGRFAQPAQVFLMPSAFDMERLPEPLRSRRDDIARLRARLF